MEKPATTPRKSDAQQALQKRSINAAVWTLGEFALGSLLRLGSNLILTRLLVPEAFGLIGVVLLLQFLIEMVSDVGIRSSVIRSDHNDDPDFISTAWVLQFCRSAVIAAIVLTSAGLIAVAAHLEWLPQTSIYADARLPWFIALASIASMAQGMTSIKILLAERVLSLGRVATLQVTAQVLSSVVSISIAALTGYPIAIAFGIIVKPVVVAIASHWLFPGPKFSLTIKRKYVDEMLSYGVWILVASLFSFFATRGAQLLFGFYLDSREFSFLSIAVMLLTIVQRGLLTLQRRVALPAFSELRRQRPDEQTQGYYRMRLVADTLAIATFLGTLFLSGPILSLLYPSEFARVIFYVQLLSVSILFVPFEVLDAVLLSEGSSRKFSSIKVVLAATVIIGIPATYYFFGATTSVLFSAMTSLAAVPLTLFYGSKVIGLDWRREALLPIVGIIAFVVLLQR